MTPQEAEIILRKVIREFDDFSTDLTDVLSGRFSHIISSYSSYKGDLIAYLNSFFNSFVSELSKLTCLDYVNLTMQESVCRLRNIEGICEKSPQYNILSEAKLICNMVLECLTLYFKGFTSDAYITMEKALTNGECHLLNLLPQIHLERGSMPMYRVRKGKCSEAKDLFHVPFDKRECCDNYRFSIAGIPALYCGASLETSVLETSIKQGEEYSAAIFEFIPKEKVAFVDLTMPNRRDYGFWERYSLTLFYPFIVACGLKVKKDEKPFRPEYVIPQLFYQLMRQHSCSFNGIIFNSSKYTERDLTASLQKNYVVLIDDCDQEKGYSESLASKLKVHGPLTFKLNDASSIQNASKQLRELPLLDINIQ